MEFKEDLQLLPKSLGMIDLRLSLSKSRSMLWQAQDPWRSHLGWFNGPCWLPAYSQHQPTAIQVTYLGHWERLSFTKVYSSSSESSSRSAFNLGVILVRPTQPRFSKNTAKSIWKNPPPFALVSNHAPHPPFLLSDHPGLPSERILFGQFSQNFL